MINIKCTRRLLTRVGAKASAPGSRGTRVLGDWHANMIPVWGGEIIICLNERSLLTVILPASAAEKLGPELRYRAFGLIERLNAPARFAEAVEAEFETIVIGKADNRTMLGRLNQVALYCDRIDLKHFNRDQRNAEDFLTRWLHGPAPYQRPTDVLHEIVRSTKGEGDRKV